MMRQLATFVLHLCGLHAADTTWRMRYANTDIRATAAAVARIVFPVSAKVLDKFLHAEQILHDAHAIQFT